MNVNPPSSLVDEPSNFHPAPGRRLARAGWLGVGKFSRSADVTQLVEGPGSPDEVMPQDSATPYEMRWVYCDEEPADPLRFDVHCLFELRFEDVDSRPCYARFKFNVLSPASAAAHGVTAAVRGCVVDVRFDRRRVFESVEATVAKAFSLASREQALLRLEAIYIREGVEYAGEFEPDTLAAPAIVAMIEAAFEGVGRGDGVTLHQTRAMDDYGSPDEVAAAKARDTETRWQDVPDVHLRDFTSSAYFDEAGYRYYLPALMRYALKGGKDDLDSPFFTCISLLPKVAPRDEGRGLGEKFDLADFIARHSFTAAQVTAIYRFLCWGASTGVFPVNEDARAGLMKWRSSALGK